MRSPSLLTRLAILLVTAAPFLLARRVLADKTWTGSGDWFADAGNWSPSVPVDGDVVVINGNFA
jgi:hypothetical protein